MIEFNQLNCDSTVTELSNIFLYTLVHFFSKTRSTSGLVVEGKDGETIWEMIPSRHFSSFIFSFKNLRFCVIKLKKYICISTKINTKISQIHRPGFQSNRSFILQIQVLLHSTGERNFSESLF